MILSNGLKILLLALLVTVYSFSLLATIIQHFSVDSGEQVVGNRLVTNKATQASNVVFKTNVVMPRSGYSEKIFDLAGLYPVRLFSYRFGFPGVLGTNEDWKIFFSRETDLGANTPGGGEIRVKSGAQTFNVFSLLPSNNINPIDNLKYNPEMWDCTVLQGAFYCTSFSTFSPVPMQNLKLNARLDHNTFENFDTTGSWGARGDAGGILGNTTDFIEGIQSLEFDKTGVAVSFAGVQSTGLALNLSGYANYFLTLYITKPTFVGGTDGSPNGSAYLSTAGTGVDFLQYNFTYPSGTSGYITIDVNSPVATFGATNLANITVLAIDLSTNVVGATFNNARLDAFTFYPQFFPLGLADTTSTVTTAVGAAGALTGTYNYRMSCKTWDNVEANAGPISGNVTVAAQQVNLTSIDVCTQGNVKSRVLYRIKNGGTIHFFLTEIPNNVATTFTDNVTDAALGDMISPLRGTVNDNSQPPSARFIEVYRNRLFLASMRNGENTVAISDISGEGTIIEPESFRIDDIVTINPNDGQTITGLKEFGSDLYIFKLFSIYGLNGVSPTDYFIDLLNYSMGSVSNASIVQWKNVLFFYNGREIMGLDAENNYFDVGGDIKKTIFESMVSETQTVLFDIFQPGNQLWILFDPLFNPRWSILSLSTFPNQTSWSSFTFRDDIIDVEFVGGEGNVDENGFWLVEKRNAGTGADVYKYGFPYITDRGNTIACLFITPFFSQCSNLPSPNTKKVYRYVNIYFNLDPRIFNITFTASATLSTYTNYDINAPFESHTISFPVTASITPTKIVYTVRDSLPGTNLKGQPTSIAYGLGFGYVGSPAVPLQLIGFETFCEDTGNEF